MGDQPENREESRMTCKRYDIPKTMIWEAWLHVKANQGAAGIDAETIERFEDKLGDNLYKLWNRMGAGSYFPPPVKAVPIPKKSGGVRILGIPTVADRIAQTAVKMWLEPRLDPIFTRILMAIEPRRVCRRLQPLRGWSDDEANDEQVFS
jgi:retron-type reverse transcriptase